MGSKNGSNFNRWSVFDSVKFGSSSTPDALMADINAAIAGLEYAQASKRLNPPLMSMKRNGCSVSSSDSAQIVEEEESDVKVVDEEFQSLNVSLSNCPTYQIDAILQYQSPISSK